VYHKQSLQTPEKQLALLPWKWRRVRPAGLRTGRTWQNAIFLTKAEDLKDHISRPLGPIFLGISPGRSPAAPV